MLIEIHMIQNHSPSNLNRDDLGAPKTCIFGGVTRARISSQCLKRSIRRSAEFQRAMEKDGGVRTRRLIQEIAKEAAGKDNNPDEKHLEAVRKVFEEGGVGLKDENTFDILFFLPKSAVTEMGQTLRENPADLAAKFAGIIGRFVKTPDIALCGRMTEFDAKGAFENLKGKFTVEAALSAAHAISTHAVVNEVDYFTAADDIPGQDAGAGHVNEAMFNSACFYKHFAIDWDQLVRNLTPEGSKDAPDEATISLCRTTVRCFLEAAAKANPAGKQHAFAAFNCPDGILVEVKTECSAPISYANAFADPVPEKSQRGLIGESIARLGQYAHDLADGYGIKAERFWFSPSLRYRLTWIDKSKKEHEQEQSVAIPSNEFGNFEKFVDTVMAKVGTATSRGAAS